MQKINLLLCTVLLSVLFTSCEPTESQRKIYQESMLCGCQWKGNDGETLVFMPKHVLIMNHDTVNWTFYKKDRIVFYYQNKFTYFYDIKEFSEKKLTLYGFCEKDNKNRFFHFRKILKK